MQIRASHNSKNLIHYELKKEKEKNYIGYLERRYGKHRAQNFLQENS